MPESRSNQALPIGSMVTGLQRGDTTPRPTRYCTCGTRLSQYNRGSRCAACELAKPSIPTTTQLCAGCQTPIYSLREKKWCSHACYERNREKNRAKVEHPATHCYQCGTPIDKPRGIRRFCSIRCRKRYNRGAPAR